MARYRVRMLEGAGDVLAAVGRAPISPSAFQTHAWIAGVYEHLAPVAHVTPFGIELSDQDTGRLAMLLPLVKRRDRGLIVAEFPDFGVTDYKKPILGPSAPQAQADCRAALRHVKGGLKGIDLLRLTSQQQRVGDHANPMLVAGGAEVSRLKGSRLRIDGTYEAYLRSRGKKYRVDVERSFRLLDAAGAWQFACAETEADIHNIFAILESQQRRRRQEAGGSYVLDQPEYTAFYRGLLEQDPGRGMARIFSLSVEREVIATLYALVHMGTVTVLRFATGEKKWSRLSPGRLILMLVMRYFIDRDIRTFDFGIGDYAFKDGFGFISYPLSDLYVSLTWKAVPYVAAHRAKLRIRANPHMLALRDRLRRKS